MLCENKNVVNFNQKLKLIETHWSPKIVASLNDYHFKLVKVKGDFIWHNHQTTDEAFIVLSGELRIDYRDHSIILKEGEMHIVKKGIEHIGKPYKIDKDDSSCFKADPFALLIHGTQKKGYFKNLK